MIKCAQEKGGGVDKTLDLSAKLAIEFTSGEDNPATDTTACSSLVNEVGQVVFDHRIFHRYIYFFICHAHQTESLFNQIPDDQALEHVNRSGIVAGGLVGITRTDSARDHWCLTYNERAKLSEDMKTMFNVGGGKEVDSHKDLGKARMRRDEEDVLKLVSSFYEVRGLLSSRKLSLSHDWGCCQ